MGLPIKAGTFRISSGFGMRGGTEHRGLDIFSVVPGQSYDGADIYAAEDGVVIEARSGVSEFGCWIWLRHAIEGKTVDTIYGHMYPDDLLVTKGQRVKRGQLIAYVGNNGQSSGPHLHFEVWTSPGRVGGKAIDPAPLLGLTA